MKKYHRIVFAACVGVVSFSVAMFNVVINWQWPVVWLFALMLVVVYASVGRVALAWVSPWSVCVDFVVFTAFALAAIDYQVGWPVVVWVVFFGMCSHTFAESA